MQTLEAIASYSRGQSLRQHAAMATVISAAAGLVMLTLLAPQGSLLAGARPGTPGAAFMPLALSL